MRQITIGGETFEVRGLTRGEVRDLRAAGLNLMTMTPDTVDDVMDAVFGLVFSEEDNRRVDALPNRDVGRLLGAVIAETYGSRDEEKNLSPSGGGPQTPTGGNTAGSAD